jgi:hypothetical protein
VKRRWVAALLVVVALLAGVVAWLWPSRPIVRERVTEAFNAMGVLKTEVSEQFQASGRWPAPRDVQPGTKTLQALRVEKDGRIAGVFAAADVPDLHGKAVYFEPRVVNGVLAEWGCRSDAPPRYLPPSCR